MKHPFRIPVQELAGPFITERATQAEREALTRPIKTGQYIQAAAIVLVVLAVVFKILGRYGFGIYLLILASALGMALFAAMYMNISQRKAARVLEQGCDPWRYAALAYEAALAMEKRTQVKQEVREMNCGIQVGSIALALCYMGRWEEGRLLAGRLLNCELTPLEAMNCRSVLMLYCYNRGDFEEMREQLQELRWAAEGIRGRRGERYRQRTLANGENFAAMAEALEAHDPEKALLLYRGMARAGETPLEQCVRSLNLGRLELQLGYTDQAAEHLRYAAEHGNRLYVADTARELLKTVEKCV